jgi:holin-like protein
MKIILQIAVVFGICWIGSIISSVLPFPFPSSVISMILLFVLLLVGVIRIEHIKEKAEFLKQNMAMFFVPAGVAIMDNYGYVQGKIVPLLFICLVSTIFTFFVTAYTVKGVMWLQNKWRGGRAK